MFLYGRQSYGEPRLYRNSKPSTAAGRDQDSFYISAGNVSDTLFARIKSHVLWSAECCGRQISGPLGAPSVLLCFKFDAHISRHAFLPAKYRALPAALQPCPLCHCRNSNTLTPRLLLRYFPLFYRSAQLLYAVTRTPEVQRPPIILSCHRQSLPFNHTFKKWIRRIYSERYFEISFGGFSALLFP